LLADRVAVFSKRPGQIIHELEIPFQRPRSPELRDEIKFLQVVKKLRGMIVTESI